MSVAVKTTNPRRAWRRALLACAILAGAGLASFAIVSPPERCPTVSVADLRTAATDTVDWFVRNQQSDGTWLYEYDADTDQAAPDYNVVRHAGAVMGLYQAAAAGIPGALASADRGAEWALHQVIELDGGAAVSAGGDTSAGSTALIVAGLAERRALTGDRRFDANLGRLGRFLVAQTEPSGAVLAYFDAGVARSLAGRYSKYYTGETYWALTLLHRLFPAGPWGATADRIGAYLATQRDDREGYWPPIPDHWAAYGLAETARFADRPQGRPLTPDEAAYARRQAELFGSQVRWISQRFGPWGVVVRGTHVPRGGGYGVIGEGLSGLWRVAGADPRLADLRAQIAERAVCNAGLAIQAQADATEAARFAAPTKVQGAWFRDGVTRMDDQQHVLAALLRTVPIVEAGVATSSERNVPSWGLWFVALVAAVNPARSAFAVPRRGRAARETAGVAGLGALGGSAALAVVAVVTPTVLDALDVSDPAARIATTAVAAVAAAVQLVRRPPTPEPALPGWGAALVPVAIPLLLAPAVLATVIGSSTDHGAAVTIGGSAVAAALFVLASLAPTRGVPDRVLEWVGRVTAAALLSASILLMISGILDV